jgi:type II secretory pathway pseudopilin PulG
MQNPIPRRTVFNTILAGAAALVAVAVPSRAGAQERQPKMQAALEALRQARQALDQASPDKGGHRVKAIELVNQAIAEVEKGIQFDRRN